MLARSWSWMIVFACSCLPAACHRRTSATCTSAARLADGPLRTRTGKLVEPDRLARLAAAEAFDCEVSEKPDAGLIDGAGTVRASLFVDERFFVLGEYLDAWTASMEGRSYCCYALERADGRALAGP